MELVRQLSARLPEQNAVEVAVCPPFTALDAVGRHLPHRVALGAQNMHPASHGAFTGEISAGMLKELGCRYVIIGHSERRHLLGETDQLIADKVAACCHAGLVPVLCVGETLTERRQGIGADVVRAQLTQGLAGIGGGDCGLVIAYEPVWAIGTGEAASAIAAEQMLCVIKEALAGYSRDVALARLLYGGSVTAANMAEYASCGIIDGALVGGASLRADQFAELVRVTSETKQH